MVTLLPREKSGGRSGFTLVELLVVMGIISILAVVTTAAGSMALQQARKAREMGAARNLITAYTSAVDADSGQYLVGYDRTVSSVAGPGGVSISGPAAQRYPWRLAPYLNNDVADSMLVGQVSKQVDPSNTYMVSCFPAFGMNYIFVGGDVQSNGTMTYPAECITRAANTADVIVFASACGTGDNQSGSFSGVKMNGYCILTPPNLTTAMWNPAAWSQTSATTDYGNVDGRYNGNAVCAFLDGSVGMKSIADLRDMRLWSRTAAQSGNANYMVTAAATGSGRF